jgi:asparagine synthase (glutamine-hydrolysing)
MCGIAGFIGYNNKNLLAEQANLIQKHRGPDNQAVWYDEYISLAHQRLSIIDLSDAANQPMLKDDFVIILNGEIYNFKELRSTHLQGLPHITQSDTEVVLDMFIKYGEKCLDFFIGMFAFAIYNKSSHEVFLARDHFGIKPLFYTRTEQGFAFASELKTLLIVPDFNRTINIKSLTACLNYLWIPGNETMFENCYKLPPSHYLKINVNNHFEIHKYWELKENIISEKEDVLIKQLRKVIDESIKRHLISDVPVSAFLSGGLDSSLISVVAQKYNPKLSTYTIATANKDKRIEHMPPDEKFAKFLAKKLSFDYNEILIDSDIIKNLPLIVRSLDEPIGDPAAINTFLMCSALKAKGVKVVLSGMGADEVFFGYRKMKALLTAKKYKRYPGFIKKIVNFIVKNLPVKIIGKGLRLSRWSKKFLTFADLPLDEAYRMSYSYYSPEQLKKLLKNIHNNEVDNLIADHERIFNERYHEDIINQMCFTDINMFMVGLNLTYTDRASMAASVEVRVPYVDKDVISTGMGIPGEFKFRNKETKYILKKAARKYLPDEIIYRPKASFGAPIRSWISNDLKDYVDDLLSMENIKKRGYLNADYVKDIIEKDRAGKEDNAYRIYQLLTLELWFREFVDKTYPCYN